MAKDKEEKFVPNIPDFTPTASLSPSIPDGSGLISDAELTTLLKGTLREIQQDREEADSVMSDFSDRVFNCGDDSSASKEAIVNLMQMKINMSDKKIKIIELLSSFKFKNKAASPKGNLNTVNNINITPAPSRRSLLQAMEAVFAEGKDADKIEAEIEVLDEKDKKGKDD